MERKHTEHKLLRDLSAGVVTAILLYQILYLLIPFQMLMDVTHTGFISPALGVLGFVLLAANVLINRHFLNLKSSWMQLTILIVLTISSLINFHYGLIDNAKCLIWQSVQMLLIVTMIAQNFEIRWSAIIKRVFLAVAAVLSMANLISFVQYFTGVSYNVMVGGYEIRQGFQEGRLFGVYNNPYDSGSISAIMMMAAIYYMRRGHSKWSRLAYGLVAVESFIMAVLGGTRSIVVGLASTVFLLVLCAVLHRSTLKKLSGRGSRILAAAVLGIAAAGLVVCAFSATHKIIDEIAVEVRLALPEIEVPDDPEKPSSPNSEKDKLEQEFGRKDVNSENISNNRFTIWKDYLTVVGDDMRVTILGASPGGYMKYIFHNYPDLYIVKHMVEYNPNMIANNRIYDTHNAYVSALISGGVTTVVLVAVFLILLISKALRMMFGAEKLSDGLLLKLCILAFLLTATFFANDLFFKCTCSSVIFWFDCGFLIRGMKEHSSRAA